MEAIGRQGGFLQENVGEAARKKGGFSGFYTRGEEIFNAVSHFCGGVLGLLAGVFGILAASAPPHMAAMGIFALCVVILYTMSALYHSLPAGRAKGVFRVFDHCTIVLLIAGTYTPYCLIALEGTAVGRAVLIAEWACAAAGIAMNAIAMNHRAVKGISMALYVAMGWLALFLFPYFGTGIPALSMGYLLAGGIAYTVGIVFFALGKKVRYFHCVWHLFDLAGTALQFVSLFLLL